MIGGTGLEHLPHFHKAAVLTVDTPWGAPSSAITILEHPSPTHPDKQIAIAFLARHGAHHELNPSEIPVRANIAALRKLGVRCIIAFSAAGSLAEEVKPRDFVVPDDVAKLVGPVFAHRLVLSARGSRGTAASASAARIIDQISQQIAVPTSAATA